MPKQIKKTVSKVMTKAALRELSVLRMRVRQQCRNKEPNVFELVDLYLDISRAKDRLNGMNVKYRQSKYDGIV